MVRILEAGTLPPACRQRRSSTGFISIREPANASAAGSRSAFLVTRKSRCRWRTSSANFARKSRTSRQHRSFHHLRVLFQTLAFRPYAWRTSSWVIGVGVGTGSPGAVSPRMDGAPQMNMYESSGSRGHELRCWVSSSIGVWRSTNFYRSFLCGPPPWEGAAYCVALCLSVRLSVCLSVCPSVPLSLPLVTSFRPR